MNLIIPQLSAIDQFGKLNPDKDSNLLQLAFEIKTIEEGSQKNYKEKNSTTILLPSQAKFKNSGLFEFLEEKMNWNIIEIAEFSVIPEENRGLSIDFSKYLKNCRFGYIHNQYPEYTFQFRKMFNNALIFVFNHHYSSAYDYFQKANYKYADLVFCLNPKSMFSNSILWNIFFDTEEINEKIKISDFNGRKKKEEFIVYNGNTYDDERTNFRFVDKFLRALKQRHKIDYFKTAITENSREEYLKTLNSAKWVVNGYSNDDSISQFEGIFLNALPFYNINGRFEGIIPLFLDLKDANGKLNLEYAIKKFYKLKDFNSSSLSKRIMKFSLQNNLESMVKVLKPVIAKSE